MQSALTDQPDVGSSMGMRGHARYVLREQLAKGGMGVIYVAYDRIARREVVYKQLWTEDASQRVLRSALFRREYDTLARLPHPNIVEVYDYGEDAEGTPYYVMERLGGADLARAAPLPFRDACRILRDIASALALVHTRRLVHRDVSPNNVRLTEDGTAKLLDFGALASFGPSDAMVGTPGFIAPESFYGEALDQRSDLYSLGALAYWTLTRHTPYSARTLTELEAALALPPPPPSAYVALPGEIDELVLSLLATDPHTRPADASYIIDRLTTIAKLKPEADEQRVARSYLAYPPLCGREAIVGALHEAVDAAVQGHGGVVLVEGEAGLGRSALLVAAAQHAQLAGMVVLRARGDASASPFRTARTLIDATAVLYPDLTPLSSAPSSLRLPPESGRRPGTDLVGVAERHARVLESAQKTLLAVADRAPLALIIDDVHLVDEQSLSLLASLAQAISNRRVTLVLSSLRERSTREAPAYVQLAASARTIALSALSNTEVGDLVHALFGTVPNALKLAHWLHEQGGGNPATTLDLMRLLMQRGLIHYTLGTFTLPFEVEREVASADLGSAALARLGGLPPEASQVVLALGLHADPLTPDVLTRATGLALGDVLRALEELTLRSLVGKSELGYQLLGSSLRDALRGSSSEADRCAMHLSLAHALLPDAASDPSLVYEASLHFLNAGHDDEALALIIGRAHREVNFADAVRHAEALERALASARKKGLSREQCLSLLIPVATAGFHGSAQRHAMHIDTALSWMADITGMALAERMRRYVGARLALVVGLTVAGFRHMLKPKSERLGPLNYLLARFVVLVCDAAALACAACDAVACRRFVRWLDPLAVLPKRSSGWIMREFCLATCELAAGQADRGSARYASLIPRLARPIAGLEDSRQAIYLGAINGRGLCEAASGNREALTLADQLGSDAFFSSFAEGIRFQYHAIRGDRESAEQCRKRAELLALHGGISWTASSSLAQCSAYAAVLSEDAIALVQVIADFERLATAAPSLRAYKRICEGWLAHVRGHSESALAIFDEVIDTPEAEGLIFVVVNRALQAAVLNALGQYARAEEVCTRIAEGEQHRGERSLSMRTLKRQLAIAMAGQGRLSQAVELVAEQLAAALPYDNPLELGQTHRDRARIALFAGDRAAFQAHFAEMERYNRGTRNPCLLRQCELLLAAAERRGLRPPSRRSLPTRSEPPEPEESDGETFVEPLAK